MLQKASITWRMVFIMSIRDNIHFPSHVESVDLDIDLATDNNLYFRIIGDE